ncbi:MAG: hypothetical protein A2171_00705 [Candidatus Levybacteria bacterium RBG_13_35_9]|nr:MAG: hypothetical protein A2171_00705 [Candidatus Levybacteria bacterium RBG_13_35_9]
MAEAFRFSMREPIEPQLTQDEISRREQAFNKVLRRLSPEQQDVITELTSVLMEKDIYSGYKADPKRVEDLALGLSLIGLKPRQSKIVLRYLNLAVI